MKKIMVSMFVGFICVASVSVNVLGQTVNPDKKKGSEGSVAFTYRGENVIYKTVRAMDGNVWLQQNLGSTKVASVATDKDSYGDLYAWGRWTDGHELREGTPIKPAVANPNNPAGLNKDGANPFFISNKAAGYWWFKGSESDAWNKGNTKDASGTEGVCPCRQIGEKWRLPTKEEWEKVVKAEGIDGVKTAFDSNLKLPLAGFRAGKTGDIVSEAKMARFWTRTAADNGNAYLLNIVFKGVDFPAYSRSGGLSIRCINKKK